MNTQSYQQKDPSEDNSGHHHHKRQLRNPSKVSVARGDVPRQPHNIDPTKIRSNMEKRS